MMNHSRLFLSFAAMLAAGGYPDFASDNVKVTFDENGAMVRAERRYTPWQ